MKKKLLLFVYIIKKINSKIVYGTISGYGSEGPWSSLPGQDLLAQSRTGLVWLNGNGGEAPTPMGLAVADMLAGHSLVEGILAAVIKRFRTNKGSHVETSLFKALLDFQFEVLQLILMMVIESHKGVHIIMLMHIYRLLMEYIKPLMAI